jgi:hypothetical protein
VSRNRKILVAATAMAVIAVAAIALWPRPAKTEPVPVAEVSGRPIRPPPPGTKRERVPMPSMPDLDPAWFVAKYADAKDRGAEKPGEAAFRATIDVFMETNAEFAKAKAEKEGLTLKEVEELTYFGYLAMQSMMFGEVERLLGHPLGEDQKAALEDLMHGLNQEFTEGMHERVAAGATEAERWAYIQETEASYLQQYLAGTGLSAAQFDDLLAGDASKMYSPGSTPLPDPSELPPERPHALDPDPRPDDPR